MRHKKTSLTRVEYLHDGGWQWWRLFGQPVERRRVSPAVHVELYKPNVLLGVSRQWRNEYGVTHWETFFLETLAPDPDSSSVIGQRVPHVRPGARVLLHTYGKPRATNVQDYLNALRNYGIDPAAVSELHRRCAPYLRLGTFPRQQLRDFFDDPSSASSSSGPLLPPPAYRRE